MGKVLLSCRVFQTLVWTFIILNTNSVSNGAAVSLDEAIATSSYTVQKWASHDLAGNIGKFIEHEERRLRIISNFSGHEEEVPFVERRLSEFKIIHKDLVKNATDKEFKKGLKANHPTTIFASLRNFLSAWENKTANTTIYGKRLTEFLEANDTKPLPTRKDLNIAGTGLTVIQATYNLSMADLLKGDVMGHKGEPLSPADCYDIGKTVLQAGLLDTAHEWFEAAVNSLGRDLDEMDQKHLTFNLSDALSALAKIAYKKKDQSKALKLFEKAVELDPDNPSVYQDYVKHRFGRDIDPISELDREKVEPWRKKFFDMCQNSTNATWLKESKKLLATNMKCRLRPSKTVPYRVYNEEILSKSPYISIIQNFLSDKEIELVKNATLRKLKKGILPGNHPSTLWQYKGGYFKDFKSRVLKTVSGRVGDVTGLNVSQSKTSYSLGEPIHVIDFGIAGLALPHGDFLKKYNIKYMGQFNGRRHATMQVYLSDVTLGGATVFIEQNITIIPKKGMAVLWYNFKPSGEPESSLFVGTCPLAVGENIVLEKGIWRLRTDPTMVCGRKQRSSHWTLGTAQSYAAEVGSYTGSSDTVKDEDEMKESRMEEDESSDSAEEEEEEESEEGEEEKSAAEEEEEESEQEEEEEPETEESEVGKSEEDKSEKKGSEKDKSETKDSEKDKSETKDSEKDKSETKDSEKDKSETKDSEKDKSETKDSEKDKSEAEGAEKEKSETEDSEKEKSETEKEKSETNESEKVKSETEDSEGGDTKKNEKTEAEESEDEL